MLNHSLLHYGVGYFPKFRMSVMSAVGGGNSEKASEPPLELSISSRVQ